MAHEDQFIDQCEKTTLIMSSAWASETIDRKPALQIGCMHLLTAFSLRQVRLYYGKYTIQYFGRLNNSRFHCRCYMD